jgi:hypothetical protein
VEIEALAAIAVDCGLKMHQSLGPGLLESAYETFREGLKRQGNRVNSFLFVIPNLIWKPASDGRSSVLPQGIMASPRTLPRPISCWFPNQVWNDEGNLTFTQSPWLKRVVNGHVDTHGSTLGIHK